jgi:hypothetical protein
MPVCSATRSKVRSSSSRAAASSFWDSSNVKKSHSASGAFSFGSLGSAGRMSQSTAEARTRRGVREQPRPDLDEQKHLRALQQIESH